MQGSNYRQPSGPCRKVYQRIRNKKMKIKGRNFFLTNINDIEEFKSQQFRNQKKRGKRKKYNSSEVVLTAEYKNTRGKFLVFLGLNEISSFQANQHPSCNKGQIT